MSTKEDDRVFHLTLAGKKLANVEGWFGCSDPFFDISAFAKTPDGKDEVWQRLYRSEQVKNSLDPTWKEAQIDLGLLCNDNLDNAIRIDVFDWEEGDRHKYMGNCVTNANALLGASEDASNTFKILAEDGTSYGELVVVKAHVGSFEKKTASSDLPEVNEDSTLYLTLEGRDMPNVEGRFGCSDPFFLLEASSIIAGSSSTTTWTTAYRSEHINDTLNPRWKEAKVRLDILCGCDLYKPIRLSICDLEEGEKHNAMGHFETTVSDLWKASGDDNKWFTPEQDGNDFGNLYVLHAVIRTDKVNELISSAGNTSRAFTLADNGTEFGNIIVEAADQPHLSAELSHTETRNSDGNAALEQSAGFSGSERSGSERSRDSRHSSYGSGRSDPSPVRSDSGRSKDSSVGGSVRSERLNEFSSEQKLSRGAEDLSNESQSGSLRSQDGRRPPNEKYSSDDTSVDSRSERSREGDYVSDGSYGSGSNRSYRSGSNRSYRSDGSRSNRSDSDRSRSGADRSYRSNRSGRSGSDRSDHSYRSNSLEGNLSDSSKRSGGDRSGGSHRSHSFHGNQSGRSFRSGQSDYSRSLQSGGDGYSSDSRSSRSFSAGRQSISEGEYSGSGSAGFSAGSRRSYRSGDGKSSSNGSFSPEGSRRSLSTQSQDVSHGSSDRSARSRQSFSSHGERSFSGDESVRSRSNRSRDNQYDSDQDSQNGSGTSDRSLQLFRSNNESSLSDRSYASNGSGRSDISRSGSLQNGSSSRYLRSGRPEGGEHSQSGSCSSQSRRRLDSVHGEEISDQTAAMAREVETQHCTTDEHEDPLDEDRDTAIGESFKNGATTSSDRSMQVEEEEEGAVVDNISNEEEFHGRSHISTEPTNEHEDERLRHDRDQLVELEEGGSGSQEPRLKDGGSVGSGSYYSGSQYSQGNDASSSAPSGSIISRSSNSSSQHSNSHHSDSNSSGGIHQMEEEKESIGSVHSSQPQEQHPPSRPDRDIGDDDGSLSSDSYTSGSLYSQDEDDDRRSTVSGSSVSHDSAIIDHAIHHSSDHSSQYSNSHHSDSNTAGVIHQMEEDKDIVGSVHSSQSWEHKSPSSPLERGIGDDDGSSGSGSYTSGSHYSQDDDDDRKSAASDSIVSHSSDPGSQHSQHSNNSTPSVMQPMEEDKAILNSACSSLPQEHQPPSSQDRNIDDDGSLGSGSYYSGSQCSRDYNNIRSVASGSIVSHGSDPGDQYSHNSNNGPPDVIQSMVEDKVSVDAAPRQAQEHQPPSSPLERDMDDDDGYLGSDSNNSGSEYSQGDNDDDDERRSASSGSIMSHDSYHSSDPGSQHSHCSDSSPLVAIQPMDQDKEAINASQTRRPQEHQAPSSPLERDMGDADGSLGSGSYNSESQYSQTDDDDDGRSAASGSVVSHGRDPGDQYTEHTGLSGNGPLGLFQPMEEAKESIGSAQGGQAQEHRPPSSPLGREISDDDGLLVANGYNSGSQYSHDANDGDDDDERRSAASGSIVSHGGGQRGTQPHDIADNVPRGADEVQSVNVGLQSARSIDGESTLLNSDCSRQGGSFTSMSNSFSGRSGRVDDLSQKLANLKDSSVSEHVAPLKENLRENGKRELSPAAHERTVDNDSVQVVVSNAFREQIAILQKSLHEKEAQLRHATERLDSMSSETKNAVDVALGNRTMQFEKLSREKVQVQSSLMEAKSEIFVHQKAAEDANNKVSMLQSAFDSSRSKKMDDLEASLTDAKAEIIVCKNEISSANERVSVLEKETSSAVDLEEHEQVCLENETLRNALQETEDGLYAYRTELKIAKQDVQNFTTENSILSQKAARLKTQVESLQREALSRVEKIARENRSIEATGNDSWTRVLDRKTLEDMARESEAKIESYEQRIAVYEVEVSEMAQENEILTEKVSKFRKVAEKNFRTVSEAKVLLRRYKEERKKQLDLNKDLKKMAKESALNLKAANMNILKLRGALQARDQNLEQMKRRATVVTTENKNLSSSLSKAQQEAERKVGSKTKSLQTALQAAKAEVDEVRLSHSSNGVTDELRAIISDLENDLDVVLEELEEARAEVEPLERALQQKESETRNLGETIEKLQKQPKAQKGNSGNDDRVPVLEEELDTLEEENEELRHDLQRLEENAAGLVKARKVAMTAKDLYEGFWKDAKEQLMLVERSRRRG